MELFTAAQMKNIDRIAIQERGIPSTLLMERAAEGILKEILALPDGAVAVFAGPGNNGGDGVAAAGLLKKAGRQVRCFLAGGQEKMTDDCKEMERRLNELGGILEEYDPSDEEQADYAMGAAVIVDALFGVGLNAPLREPQASAVKLMNLSHAKVVSADIPSGIHADTGQVLGSAVRADVTVTFSAGKPGLYVGKGAVHSGRVVIADIGIASDLMEQGCGAEVMPTPVLRRRERDAHKGTFGKLFILAGSVGYTGAPVLASRAAVRSGAGLVTLAVPREIYPVVAVKCDEAMPWPLPDAYDEILQKASACSVALIGPGLGQSEQAQELALALLRDLKCPMILDADGLNILSRHIDVLDKRQAMTVLTPHDGEFARLSGCTLPIVDRLQAARDFAENHHCILVLKGHRTITAAWSRRCTINTTGNPGMARGGSGDALAGLIAGLMAQRPGQENAISEAVWFHGRAGDLAAEEKGEYGMTVGDLIEQIPYAMKECEEE